MNLLSHHAQDLNFSRRKIYSEEKSRQKAKVEEIELLTFYKPKPIRAGDHN